MLVTLLCLKADDVLFRCFTLIETGLFDRMDMTTCLKSLLLAIQQYRDGRTAQNAAQLQKQVEVSSAVCLMTANIERFDYTGDVRIPELEPFTSSLQ